MPRFEYPCPDCRTRSSLHGDNCRFEGVERTTIENAYLDVVAPLTDGVTETDALRDRLGFDDAADGPASELRAAALSVLQRDGRVDETNGRLRILPPDEYREAVAEPTVEPIRTVYREGSVPGCHDNAVFAMIAWYEMVGLSWQETRDRVVEWLEESGAWDRGGFEEGSPAELVAKKRHVYQSGYGWKEKAEAAKRVIERRT